ncbi:relaxase/mobilization nuclease domain-containing protein [Maribacter sp. IgM3_T14_3]|uniref:relaxase/mobilization nuclease domain-containing protein n=1 Tax=Maribacter sp. IgM3_T14_3 TaxID=3415140 RepID=UPI003C6EEC8A
MIAKQIKGKDFYGVLGYNEKKVGQGMGYVLDTNITYGKTVHMTQEFNIVRQLRPRLGKAVYHVSLSLPYEDTLSDKQFTSLGMDYLTGMGFEDNQYIMYRHQDQEHEHIHIIANRVKFSGELVNDSKDYERSERLVRKMELKYSLSQLEDNKLTRKATITHKEIQKAFRTGEPPLKLTLQYHLENAISNSKNTSEFKRELGAKNISAKFNVSKSTGRVTGISFRYKEIIYKGSSLGRQYSWNNIIKRIDYEQDRDRTIIFETNRTERRIDISFEENSNSATAHIGKKQPIPGRHIKAAEQPKSYLEKAPSDGLKPFQIEDNPWNAFKLELDNDSRFKRKNRNEKGWKR